MKLLSIRIVATLGIVFSAQFARAQEQAPPESLTVDQVVRDAVRNNDRIRAAAYMEEAARREIGPAGSWDDPMLMMGVENLPTSFAFDHDPMTMKVIGLSQFITYSGERGFLADAQRAASDVAREDRRAVIIEIATAAKSAYTRLQYQQLFVDDIKRQRDLSGEVVSSVRIRMAANLSTANELAVAQTAVWRLEAELLAAQDEASTALNELNALRGHDSPSGVQVVSQSTIDTTIAPLENWIAAAHANYAPLRRLAKQSEQYRLRALASQRMGWPMLELSAEYGFRESIRHPDGELEAQDDMMSFGAAISLPIFRGRQNRQMAQSMIAMQRQYESEAEQLEREVVSTLRTLHGRTIRLQDQLKLYRDRIVPADEDAYKATLSGYSAGRVLITQVLEFAAITRRDTSTAHRLAWELARTLAAAERLTANVDEYLALQDSD